MFFLIGILSVLSKAPVAGAAPVEREYQTLSSEFRRILGFSNPDEQRTALERLIEKAGAHIRRDSNGKTLDRAYYLLAQCHHRLHDIAQSDEHLKRAVENYRRVTTHYPDSVLADDAQYLIGILYLGSDPQQAHAELKEVERRYPSGDMLPRAREKLGALERRFAHLRNSGSDSHILKKEGSASAESGTVRRDSATPLPRLTEIKHWSGDQYTRVAIYVDSPVKFQEISIAGDPGKKRQPKIYIDLEACRADKSLTGRLPVGDSFLEDVLVEQIGPSQTRVTLDANAIDRYRIFSLPDPFRIIVDVRGTRDLPRKTAGTPWPETPGAALSDLPAQLSLEVKRIVIDPGHGGKDTGAISPNGVYEKDLVLSIARRLKRVLEQDGGFQVLLTRNDDRYLTLEERTAIANAQRADLFISLHTNAHENREIYGTETYFLNFSKDQESARTAAMENATSPRKLSDLEGILQGLMLNTKLNESARLAHAVQRSMIEELSLGYREVKDLGTKQAPFYVLLGAEMPSILVEAGFITHEREEKRLKDHGFQEHLAAAITRGIQAYIKEMRGFAAAGGKP